MQKALFKFIVFSLFLHLLFVSFIYISQPSSPPQKNETVEISYIPKKNSQKKNLQIVEQDKKAINNETPTKDAYLGRHNQSVKKQTRAAKTGQFINSNNGNPLAKRSQENKKTPSKKIALKSLLPSLDFHKIMIKNKKSAKNNPSHKNQNLGRKGQTSQTDDHLKNVAIGIETVLNSREFLYYAYYSRIKNKIRQHWGKRVRSKIQKLLQAGRSIASNRDRITKVIIILNKKGTLVGVQVLGKSGVRDLDEAAVEAFREAAPFPNPPKGMVEPDGRVRIHWDFILEAYYQEFKDEHHYLARRP